MMGPSATLVADYAPRRRQLHRAGDGFAGEPAPARSPLAPRQLSRESVAAGAMLLGAHTGAGSRPGKDNSRT